MKTDTREKPPAALATAAAHPARNGAETLLDTLVACGIDTIFGYPGGAALPLYDALHGQPAIRHVLVRHEQAAVHAAEGYARSTGPGRPPSAMRTASRTASAMSLAARGWWFHLVTGREMPSASHSWKA